ncbi:MAG: hypothetical protein LBB05_01160 [Puniceicoccales bacterium]|jgi:hypothetical protein|nr:hypothetical protein [Puniceicoccales bacterium]
MGIVCSNPVEQHFLPWPDVKDLSFRNKYKGIEIKEHAISTRAGRQKDGFTDICYL